MQLFFICFIKQHLFLQANICKVFDCACVLMYMSLGKPGKLNYELKMTTLKSYLNNQINQLIQTMTVSHTATHCL